jgi:PAS domain S-box-containing protein
VTDRPFHAELADLARAIEALRAANVRQRQAHEEHRAAMDEIVASLGEGLLAVDPKGRVVVANARVAEMFGGADALVGRAMVEVVRKQPVVAALDKALRGEASVDRVTVGAAEEERQIEVRAVPVEASPEIAAVALFIDVTTIERLQRVRKDFLDDFSHEVRTPLTGLRSAAETLDAGGLTREHEQQLRQIMQRQIARIERLVTDLTALNQIESGELVLEPAPVNLRDVLGEVIDDFQERTSAIYFSLQGEAAIALVDAARAQQIFVNLLDNACKHGGASGEVAVEIARDEGEAVVRVSDQGPGIPPHELDRVFHRFYRVDRSRSQPGTGLGLAIAKHLVALHGGSIRAFNRSAGGATFEVRLPLDLS